MSRTTSRLITVASLAATLLLATPAFASLVPVFDWVAARTDSLIGVDSGFAQFYNPAIDANDGSIYIANFFSGTPDFDPSGGTDSIASAGSFDCSLSKFDSDGNYLWTKTWGGTSADFDSAVTVSSDGSVYVSGTFTGTVDFDPGAGTTNATPLGGRDVFLSKFDSNGTFQWVKTWGYTGSESKPFNIGADSDNSVYVEHYFGGEIDFDSSAGIATSTSTGGNDIYLSKFASDGTWQWTKTWGGTGDDEAVRLQVTDDGIFSTGFYSSASMDVDPGAGTTNVTNAGNYDAWLTKLTLDGDFVWGKSWGGTSYDFGYGVGFDSDGNVYAAGPFYGTADFDPGAGTTNATAVGDPDAYLLKLNSSGIFQWVKAWGGNSTDGSYTPVIIGDEVIVPGLFSTTVDFDPSGGTNTKVSNGGQDVFISIFDTDGNYYRTDTFGGSGDDWTDLWVTGGTSAIGSETPKLIFDGYYKSAPADFDPSGAKAEHSSNGTSEYLISFDLITPEITESAPSKDDLTEGASDSLMYTITLSTPPTDDVVFTVTPDDQLLASPSTLTFSSSTWATPQTVTVSPVEDDTVEGTHTGSITTTVASNDSDYDDALTTTFEITIHDDDSDTDGGSGGGVSNAIHQQEKQDAVPQPAVPALENNAELIAQIQAKIAELKQQLIELLTQKLKELQAELAKMQ
jgi:hypothetical protein